MMDQALRVLVVDDSSLYRRILTNAVRSIQIPTELDTAPTGAIALRKIEPFRPDIVLLDIEMPEMSGIEVLKAIKLENPHIVVVLVSGVNSRSADITMEGLSSGASDFISKPSGPDIEANTRELQQGLKQAFEMLLARQARRDARSASAQTASAAVQPAAQPLPAPSRRSVPPRRLEVIGLGISTGGPSALGIMIPQLPKDLSLPMVIVQHMPPIFTASLARSLDRVSELGVCEAQEGQVLEAGMVYIAPGGIHTIVRGNTDQEQNKLMIRYDDSPPVNSCKPAVDTLFSSLAETAGARTLAVIMTGMGRDGRDGAARIKERQGYCLSQSEDTCTVYGMPQAVDQAGISDERVPLPEMASRIYTIVNGARI